MRIPLFHTFCLTLNELTPPLASAYRVAARAVHPDKVGKSNEVEGTAAFVLLAAAYEIVSDEQLRRDYERGVGRFAVRCPRRREARLPSRPTCVGRPQVRRSRDSNEETVVKSSDWARSQYDRAADPILTVKGWVVITLIVAAIWGVGNAAERARLALRARDRQVKATQLRRASQDQQQALMPGRCSPGSRLEQRKRWRRTPSATKPRLRRAPHRLPSGLSNAGRVVGFCVVRVAAQQLPTPRARWSRRAISGGK